LSAKKRRAFYHNRVGFTIDREMSGRNGSQTLRIAECCGINEKCFIVTLPALPPTGQSAAETAVRRFAVMLPAL
jgi:hypothetical protein